MSRKQAYQLYLQSDHWRNLRGIILERDLHMCVKCGSTDRLEVHHKRYEKRWEDARNEDLETLCRSCHKSWHSKEGKQKNLPWNGAPKGKSRKMSKKKRQRMEAAFGKKKKPTWHYPKGDRTPRYGFKDGKFYGSREQ